MWLSSSCLLACVLGNVSALCIRVLAALILCLMSWCELKSRYVCVCRFPKYVNFEVVTMSCYKCI